MPAIAIANLAGANYGKYEFGIDQAAIAKALRDLADDLDSKDAIPVSATVYRRSRLDDYPETVIVLKLIESVDERNRGTIKELHAPDSQFPVDVARVE